VTELTVIFAVAWKCHHMPARCSGSARQVVIDHVKMASHNCMEHRLWRGKVLTHFKVLDVVTKPLKFDCVDLSKTVR
jgi:hypothetical protein